MAEGSAEAGSAINQSTLPFGTGPGKKTRRSYTRDEKLKVISYYKANDFNAYRTCKFFDINSKNLHRWPKQEGKIKASKRGSRRVKFDRRAEFPAMEEKLHSEFRELRRKGLKVKAWWFKTRARQLLDVSHPGNKFKLSDGWFTRFKTRFKISLRRPTNTSQRPPNDKEEAICKFHRTIRRLQLSDEGDGAQEERFKLCQIANMDQTPLPFSFTDGPTYDTTNASSIWVRSNASGLDKRQCTVQLTIFADGEARVKPLVIFKGQGKRISLRERISYDKWVTVAFQKKAWCDEHVMLNWIRYCWKPNIKEEMMLIIDVHKAQTTDNTNSVFNDCNTTPVHVPPGGTYLVQPLDVSVNAPFKRKVEECAMQHISDNLEEYVSGKFSASARRVLLTGWIGQAWEDLSADKEMITRSFKKCGISVAADGSEDDEIHIEGLEDYHYLSTSEDSEDSSEEDDHEEDEDIEELGDPFDSDSEEED